MFSSAPSAWKPIAVLFAGLLGTFTAQASLRELADNELAQVTGQAFINLTTDSYNDMNFTRVNFGLDVQTQLNVKRLRLGEYPRIRTGSTQYAGLADIDIKDFALGSVNDATGAIDPFNIRDPYLELAHKDGRVVGVRMGFGEAYGKLSGDIQSLTGNIDFRIQGTGSELKSSVCQSSFLTCLGSLLLVSNGKQYAADGSLISADYNRGGVEQVRGQYVGLTNGTKIQELLANGALNSAGLLSRLSASGCSLIDLSVCFSLGDFKTLPVGSLDNPAKGVFISVQTERVSWKDGQGNVVSALQGAFMNIPKVKNAQGVEVPAIIINFLEKGGIARVDTCLGAQTQGC